MGNVEQRALELQSAGPDEYPFGYYLHLAQEEANRVPGPAPHEFVGRLDRWCEKSGCGRPDRDPIHTSFEVHGTVTGRMTSHLPNIQEI